MCLARASALGSPPSQPRDRCPVRRSPPAGFAAPVAGAVGAGDLGPVQLQRSDAQSDQADMVGDRLGGWTGQVGVQILFTSLYCLNHRLHGCVICVLVT